MRVYQRYIHQSKRLRFCQHYDCRQPHIKPGMPYVRVTLLPAAIQTHLCPDCATTLDYGLDGVHPIDQAGDIQDLLWFAAQRQVRALAASMRGIP